MTKRTNEMKNNEQNKKQIYTKLLSNSDNIHTRTEANSQYAANQLTQLWQTFVDNNFDNFSPTTTIPFGEYSINWANIRAHLRTEQKNKTTK